MQKLLFVIPTIACGGAERSLVELLKRIDYTNYKVDLMLFRKDDMYYLEQIPKEVTILENDEETKLAFDHVKHLIKSPIFFKKLNVVIYRIWQTAKAKLKKILKIKKYNYDWKILKKYVPRLKNKYDVAIGYIGGNSIYYIIDKVDARKKIGYFHTEYEKGGFDKNIDIKYFSKLDCLFSVSKEMTEKFKELMPEISDKFKTMYNILDIESIQKKAEQKIEFDDDYQGIKIVSIGNLRYVKGYDISIEACKILKESEYEFKWYILGEGNERKKLESLIKKYKLENNIILLGLINNPYAYLKRADIYVQTSRYEGFSTSVSEAKVLNKPIVITDCPGMNNQIENKENGTITGYQPKEIAEAIAELINNENLRKKYMDNLKKEVKNNSIENQMKVFYQEL